MAARDGLILSAEPRLDPAAEAYAEARRRHWDALASTGNTWAARAYRRRLTSVYRFLVAPGQRVLEVGCGPGALLAALEPADGIGVDFAPEMAARAQRAFPQCRFVVADAHDLRAVDGPFDVVILSDLVNDLWDVQRVLEGWTGQELDFNPVFKRGQVQSPKVRAFVDSLVERLNFDADYMHGLCPDRKPCGKAGETPAVVAQQLARAARQSVEAEPAETQEPVELAESA